MEEENNLSLLYLKGGRTLIVEITVFNLLVTLWRTAASSLDNLSIHVKTRGYESLNSV